MFARASSAFVLALPVLAAATALPRTEGSGPSNQCNTGPIQCCETVQSASSVGGFLGFLLTSVIHLDLGSIVGLVASSCSPITVIGGGGSSCSAQPVCCTNNYFNAVVGIGCTPININL